MGVVASCPHRVKAGSNLTLNNSREKYDERETASVGTTVQLKCEFFSQQCHHSVGIGVCLAPCLSVWLAGWLCFSVFV